MFNIEMSLFIIFLLFKKVSVWISYISTFCFCNDFTAYLQLETGNHHCTKIGPSH